MCSAKAIDGNPDYNFRSGSCTHTDNSETDPWWKVELLSGPRVVLKVKVTNRGDSRGRLNGFTVLVDEEVCATDVQIRDGQTKEVTCKRRVIFILV